MQRQKKIFCTLGLLWSVSLCGCGGVVKVAGRFLGKGASSAIKNGSDDVLSSSKQFWKTPKIKTPNQGARAAAKVAMSAAKTGASRAFTGAVSSTVQCGEKLSRVIQSYNLLTPASRVAVQIVTIRLRKNESRLEAINLQLVDTNLSDHQAAQLQAECDKISALNGRMKAKVESLTAELG